ncbi:MAG: tetratricopeptide repeat protein [Verrucomicrobiota bacterium]|jgi:serine/threonine protein kinase
MNDARVSEESVFNGALLLPAAQREDYLKAVCGKDEALLARVHVLLEAGEQTEGAMAEPASLPPRKTIILSPPAGEKPGDRIGHYKILQLVGEGGCGAVYMAEQERPIRRRVALKVIKLGMDTKNVIARFELERQALALMDHPNIAKVFDAGSTEAGRPYFVMELVRGVKITDYCDQHNLTTAQRLELFTQVCRAIQHAHQKGIIHRDIKPSNILVTLHDGVPVPKVIDFGIAKATHQRLTDKTVFTQFEQFIGTPAYMSPEQAEMSGLDIDTRSDIYSLGVLLYELLTSQTPINPAELMSAGLDAMRRLLREKEPPRPSTCLSTMINEELTTVAKHRQAAAPKLIHLVRGDLDWIVMKALEKDRSRRYDTAVGFAADIEHFLKNEPVQARSPSALYRFQKLVRRNKLACAAAAAVSLAILLGLAVSTGLYLREKEARRQADNAAEKSRQVSLFLENMLKGVGPAVALGRDTTLLREILDHTSARVTTDLRNEPEVEAEICNTLGEVYRELGLPSNAEEFHSDARALQAKISGGKLADAALSLNDLAVLLRDEGRLAEAESLHREALALRRKVYGNTHADVAISLNNLALVLRCEDKLAEAERTHLEALAIQQKLFGKESLHVATSLNNLALTLRDEGRFADAEAGLRQALAIEQHEFGENDPRLGVTMDNLACLLLQEGNLSEAAALANRSLVLQRKLFGREHPAVATAMNDLAMILTVQGHLADAEQLHRDALAMRRKLLGGEHPEVAASLDHLSQTLRLEKKLAEAESLTRSALDIRRTIYGNEHSTVAASFESLALVLRDEDKLNEAETSMQAALAMWQRILGEQHPQVATARKDLASIQAQEGLSTKVNAQLTR